MDLIINNIEFKIEERNFSFNAIPRRKIIKIQTYGNDKRELLDAGYEVGPLYEGSFIIDSKALTLLKDTIVIKYGKNGKYITFIKVRIKHIEEFEYKLIVHFETYHEFQ